METYLDQTYRLGDSGAAISEIAGLLHGLGLLDDQPRDVFDADLEEAVRAFQQQRGLLVDGQVGPGTYRRLNETRWHLGDRILIFRAGDLMVGDDVYQLQRRLLDLGFAIGRVDGYFGVETSTGLTDFQRNYGLVTDGTCGPETLKALTRLSPMVQGGAPNAMRAESRIRAAGPNLSDKVIVIDISRAHNLPEAHSETSDIIVKDLAQRIAGRFGATGVSAYLTTSSFGSADLQEERERAKFANELRADLLIAIALDYSENPEAKGISAYFFGDTNHDTWSTTGEKLAGLIQREIVARTGMTNLRSHAKTWDLLRMTRMPAMWMDIGYVSSSPDMARLQDASQRDLIAEAIVVATQRFYLTPEEDEETGRLNYADIKAKLREFPAQVGLGDPSSGDPSSGDSALGD